VQSDCNARNIDVSASKLSDKYINGWSRHEQIDFIARSVLNCMPVINIEHHFLVGRSSIGANEDT
jgi:hypothetical protein